MGQEKRYIAVDLGAESGRVIIGAVSQDKLDLQEIHRFDNGPIEDGLLLGADNLLHYKARDAGEKVFMSMGLYIWHYYRSGIPTNMGHLR